MNETLKALETMLSQVLGKIDVPFTLQGKYQPIIDNLVHILHQDIDDITDHMLSAQENIDNG